MVSFFYYLTMTLFITVCLFMILLVLIQKGRGGGLASAFGGAGGNTAFGSKTGDVLTWATSIVFGVFLVLAVALNLLANQYHRQTVGFVDPAATEVTTVAEDEPIRDPAVPLTPSPEGTSATPATQPGAVESMAPAATQPASTQPAAADQL